MSKSRRAIKSGLSCLCDAPVVKAGVGGLTADLVQFIRGAEKRLPKKPAKGAKKMEERRDEAARAPFIAAGKAKSSPLVVTKAYQPPKGKALDLGSLGKWDLAHFEEIPRGKPTKVSERAKTAFTPKNVERFEEFVRQGVPEGGLEWYDLSPLWRVAKEEMSPEEFKRLMALNVATSARSAVKEQIKRASLAWQLAKKGEPWPMTNKELTERFPGYGHIAHNLHSEHLPRLISAKPEELGFDPMGQPKYSSYLANLTGNELPVTADTHFQVLSGFPMKKVWNSKLGENIDVVDFNKNVDYPFAETFAQQRAARMGIMPSQYQSSAWVGGRHETGVRDARPFTEIYDELIARTAQKLGITPTEALIKHLRGEIALMKKGGLASLAGGGYVAKIVRKILSDMKKGEWTPPVRTYPDNVMHQLSPEQLSDVEGQIAEEVADLVPAMRRSPRGALGVLERGQFLNQFQANRSSGAYSPSLRTSLESFLMGYPRETPPRMRPKYGYMGYKHSPWSGPEPEGNLDHYGPVTFVFKPGVRDRTTITFGDSLDSIYDTGDGAVAGPVLAKKPSIAGAPVVFEELLKDRPLLNSITRDYVEAQFHGPLKSSDISEVFIPYELHPRNRQIGQQHELGLLKELLEQQSIPFTAYAGGGLARLAKIRELLKGTRVVDEKGDPLLVYRGEHGETPAKGLQTRRGSISFGSKDAANTYALEPNDYADAPVAPRVYPSYLRITKPFVDTDDPFVDARQLADALGPDLTRQIVGKHSDYFTHTNRWEDELASQYKDPLDFLERNAPETWADLYADAFPILDDADVIAALKAKGYDGAIHGGAGETAGEREYRIFDPSQALSAFDLGGFKSGGALERARQKLAGGGIVRNFLLGLKGSKIEEALTRLRNKAVGEYPDAELTPQALAEREADQLRFDQQRADGEGQIFRGDINDVAGHKRAAAMRDWVDRNLKNYIIRQLGAADDPLRQSPAIRERMRAGQAASTDQLLTKRPAAEWFETLYGESDSVPNAHLRYSNKPPPWFMKLVEKDWPRAWSKRQFQRAQMDAAQLKPETLAHTVSDDQIRKLKEAPPEILEKYQRRHAPPVELYDIDPQSWSRVMQPVLEDTLDYLRTLPPESLNKVSVPDAIRKSHEWHEAMRKQKELKNSELINKLPVVKTYPGGEKWVEMGGGDGPYQSRTRDGVVTAEPDDAASRDMRAAQQIGKALGHCYQDPGTCAHYLSGSKLYTLIDAKGKPRVTVEASRPKVEKWVSEDHPETAAQLLKQLKSQRPSIDQIRGPQNDLAPEDSLEFLRDFISSGDFASVPKSDLEHLGLRKYTTKGGFPLYARPSDLPREFARYSWEHGTPMRLSEDDYIRTVFNHPKHTLAYLKSKFPGIANEGWLKKATPALKTKLEADIRKELRSRSPSSYDIPDDWRPGMAGGGIVKALKKLTKAEGGEVLKQKDQAHSATSVPRESVAPRLTSSRSSSKVRLTDEDAMQALVALGRGDGEEIDGLVQLVNALESDGVDAEEQDQAR